MLVTFVNRFLDACLVAGVVWPFIPQGHLMYATKDASGWNTLTSLLLIVSSTLRVFFYYCRAFDEVFLFQALFCIVTQLAMTYIVVRVTQKRAAAASHGALSHRSHTLWNAGLSRFWRWTDAQSYFLAVGLLAAAVYAVSLLCWRSALYREALGTLALGIEAFVPVPQAWQNASRRSTVGLSAVLIICWAFGDAFKTTLAIARSVPVQFILCGSFQLAMDAVLLWQIYVLYPDKKEDDPIPTLLAAQQRHDAPAGPYCQSGDAESPCVSDAEERALLGSSQASRASMAGAHSNAQQRAPESTVAGSHSFGLGPQPQALTSAAAADAAGHHLALHREVALPS